MCQDEMQRQRKDSVFSTSSSSSSEESSSFLLTPPVETVGATVAPRDKELRQKLQFIRNFGYETIHKGDKEKLIAAVRYIDPLLPTDISYIDLCQRAFEIIELSDGANVDTVRFDQTLDYNTQLRKPALKQIKCVKSAGITFDSFENLSISIAQEKDTSALNSLISEVFQSILEQLSDQEQQILRNTPLSITFFLSGGSGFDQSSAWRMNPDGSQAFAIFLKRDFILNGNSVTDLLLSSEKIEEKSVSKMNGTELNIYLRGVITHELGHAFHALLHPAEFRILNARAKDSKSYEQRKPPKEIIDMMVKAFGINATYGAMGGSVEAIAEIFNALIHKIPVPTKLYEWYARNGGPQIKDPTLKE